MTNEEIEKTVRQILSDWDADNPAQRILQRDVERVRSLVAQAYGEAMRAMCEFCQHGIPVVSAFANQGDPAWTTWHRPAVGAYTPCTASPIHSLVDELVQSLPS